MNTGRFTTDGCPVDVYELLPDEELVGSLADLSDGAHVLDLGAGTGRITRPLLRNGCKVVAVDNSLSMLASISGAERVCADIRQLRLQRRFDAVVMASHLVNTDDAELRRAFVATVANHLAPQGTAYFEWHPGAWFERLTAGTRTSGRLGPIDVDLEVHEIDEHRLLGTVSYRHDGHAWAQRFTAARLSHAELGTLFDHAGLQLLTQDADADWQLARPLAVKMR